MVVEEYPAKKRYQDSRVAETYDKERFSTFLGKLVDKLEKAALNKALKGIDKDVLILDFPCGTGRITEFLLQKGYFVSGADISEEMMDVAKKKLQKFSRFKGVFREDAEHTSFSKGAFDYITSVRLMGHLPPNVRIKVLKEMKRIAANQLIITFYVTDPFTRLSKFIQRRGREIDTSLCPTSMKCLKEEIKQAGLNIVKIIPMLKYISECHYFVLEPSKGENVAAHR
jgi:SAM-dependent methyltransferase